MFSSVPPTMCRRPLRCATNIPSSRLLNTAYLCRSKQIPIRSTLKEDVKSYPKQGGRKQALNRVIGFVLWQKEDEPAR